MFELTNVSKTYRSKTTKVEALKNISVTLPNKGLVFIVGKSGSGKSTLLNLIGGLDGCDKGDIIINGTSTINFKAGDYDAYRNSFVGFVFQEYNLIESFSVEKNIKIAAELQNKYLPKAEIDSLLDKLDLAGLASRMPRELSSGQKQRVAIARALVKDPEVILADEPTGSLDSETGKQIMDLFKSLSQDRLIIIVSHDLEFAKQYADRIISLKDGEIIHDLLTRHETSKEDVKAYHGTPSRFHVKNALKFAWGDVFRKPVRLAIITLLLSIAYVLFGIIHALGHYDIVKCANESMKKSGIDYISMTRIDQIKQNQYKRLIELKISDEDIAALKNQYPDNHFFPVMFYFEESISRYIPVESSFAEDITGGVELSDELIECFELTLYAGRFPQANEAENEIAVSKHFYDLAKEYGYRSAEGMIYLNSPADLLGKELYINHDFYFITGIVDTHYDNSRYQDLFTRYEDNFGDEIMRGALFDEYHVFREHSIHHLVFLRKNYINEVLRAPERINTYSNGETFIKLYWQRPKYIDSDKGVYYCFSSISTLKKMPEKVYWRDGIARTELAEDEVLIPISSIPEDVWIDELPPYGDMVKHETLALINDFASKHFDEVKDAFESDHGTSTYFDYADYIYSRPNTNIYHPGFTQTYFKQIAAENIIRCHYFKTLSIYAETSHKHMFDNEVKIVGYYESVEFRGSIYGDPIIVSEEMYSHLIDSLCLYDYSRILISSAENHNNKKILKLLREDLDYPHFAITNEPIVTIKYFDAVAQEASRIVIIIATIFAVFSAFLLSGYINIVIKARKKDIGILRALGARMLDLFKIFFIEGLLIGGLSIVISVVGSVAVNIAIDNYIRKSGMIVSILNFGLVQVLLMLGIAVVIAFLATIYPVYSYSKKKPVEVINRIL